MLLSALVLAQVAVGIVTLVSIVPIPLALMHQALAADSALLAGVERQRASGAARYSRRDDEARAGFPLFAIDHDPFLHHPCAPARHELQRQRVDAVLYLQHTSGERLGVSPASTGTAPCTMIGPVSIFGADEMDRRAMHANACRKRALVRVEAWEKGEQGRVDVQHPIAPCLDEFTRKDPHEAGEADDLDSGTA